MSQPTLLAVTLGILVASLLPDATAGRSALRFPQGTRFEVPADDRQLGEKGDKRGAELAAGKAALTTSGPQPKEYLLSKYLSNEELAAHIDDYVERCSHIAMSFRYGKSEKGVSLLALSISSSKGKADNHKPAFKIVGNLHGDEPSGRALTLLLAEKICDGYKKDVVITRLVDSMQLILVPSANPDGFAMKRRSNSKNVDLNRNFPDPQTSPAGADLTKPQGREAQETLAMMGLIMSHRCVASLALHEGALCANYPLDGYADGDQTSLHKKHAAPDDATFQYLASKYATLHTTMSKSTTFGGGITNGAAWYPIYGGMQDWNYFAAQCLEITLELSQNKWPDMKALRSVWEQNEVALVEYPLAAVFTGFRGAVTSSGQGVAIKCDVQVAGISKNYTCNDGGVYFRPLAPGNYTVTISAPEYAPQTMKVSVPEGNKGVVLDVVLTALPGTRAAELNAPVVTYTESDVIFVESEGNDTQTETGFVVVDESDVKDLEEQSAQLTVLLTTLGVVSVPLVAITLYVLYVKKIWSTG